MHILDDLHKTERTCTDRVWTLATGELKAYMWVNQTNPEQKHPNETTYSHKLKQIPSIRIQNNLSSASIRADVTMVGTSLPTSSSLNWVRRNTDVCWGRSNPPLMYHGKTVITQRHLPINSVDNGQWIENRFRVSFIREIDLPFNFKISFNVGSSSVY